jgi:outer membrane receptor protein involved in Fe transport
VFAGLKGRYSDKIAFNLKASYEKVDSMYFFVNDNTDSLRNKFVPVYDNATLTSLGGEISWQQSEKLQLLMKANYYQYQLVDLKHPWHKPAFEASISADYSLQDKILIGTDVFLTGKRFAMASDGSSKVLTAYLDANLSVNYRYTKTISFFLKFNNLTASRYQVWNQYPAQRFQFLAGFSYAL